MAFDGFFVLFLSVISCSQVPMICGHIGVDGDGFEHKFNLLCMISQFSQGFSFEMIKLALIFIYFQSLFATLSKFSPSSHLQQSGGGQQIFFFAFLHVFCECKGIFQFFFLDQFLEFLLQLMLFQFEDGLAVVELFQLYLHLTRLIITRAQELKLLQIQLSYYMLPRLTSTLAAIAKMYRPSLAFSRSFWTPRNFNYQLFSSQKGLTPTEVPSENLKIRQSSAKIGEQEIDYYRTEGGISILDKVPGVKSPKGELYVLSFRCGRCNTQSIRSFTKHAYHNGVVLVRCGGCPHIHLVADNLGWFNQEPINIQTMHKGEVKKVHDHVAIVKFLNKAFGEGVEGKQGEMSLSKDELKVEQKKE